MVFPTSSTHTIRLSPSAELVRVTSADTATTRLVGIQPLQEVVYPRSGGLGNEGRFCSLTFRFKTVRDGGVITCRETSAKLLLAFSVCGVDIV